MQLLNDQTKSANQHSLKSERKSERMKSMKKLISIILAVAVIFALNITAFAGGFITDESAMSTGAKADPPYAAAPAASRPPAGFVRIVSACFP